jgi:hypothetical protein
MPGSDSGGTDGGRHDLSCHADGRLQCRTLKLRVGLLEAIRLALSGGFRELYVSQPFEARRGRANDMPLRIRIPP